VTAAPVHYYIYYRIASARAESARRAVAMILERVQCASGVSGRWLQRDDEPLLWMEVYDGVRDTIAFEAALAEAVVATGLSACLAAGTVRKTERFVAAPPSA
jgi:hypothetical protein